MPHVGVEMNMATVLTHAHFSSYHSYIALPTVMEWCVLLSLLLVSIHLPYSSCQGRAIVYGPCPMVKLQQFRVSGLHGEGAKKSREVMTIEEGRFSMVTKINWGSFSFR